MKTIRIILVVWLAVGAFAPLRAQLYETSSESNQSERRLQMTDGNVSFTLTPLSSATYRSKGGSARGITGSGLVTIGAGAPSTDIGGNALPSVSFGRGRVGGELVSDPTQPVARRIGGGNSGGGQTDPTNPADVFNTPMGDIPWLLLTLCLLFSCLRRLPISLRASTATFLRIVSQHLTLR